MAQQQNIRASTIVSNNYVDNDNAVMECVLNTTRETHNNCNNYWNSEYNTYRDIECNNETAQEMQRYTRTILARQPATKHEKTTFQQMHKNDKKS